MSETRASTVKLLFEKAIDLPREQREQFLQDQTDHDAELLDEVRELLDHADSAPSGFLGGSEPDGIHSNLDIQADREELLGMPEQFGKFRIIRLIGMGGMGAVFEAKQPHPNRTVALKVLKPGLMSRERIRRFEREVDLLGRLQHPGIAQVYEAGTVDTEAGKRPYLAMELVEGRPLDEWVRTQRPSKTHLLHVMADVCDAVEHAHTRGIIHRDLKPSNILIADAGLKVSGTGNGKQGTDSSSQTAVVNSHNRPQVNPKVLDFGVARITDADIQTMTMQTDVGQLIGTLPYMSPEQVASDSRLLDVRSDVYALGVLFFELLTERLPYDVQHRSVAEAARTIRDEDPTRLSSIDASLRGDLETIVLKALEKDRGRRYASAGALAADIRRSLVHEPISARPVSAVYRMKKFARRNATLVGGVAATFVALVIGLSLATYGFVSASRERDAAQAERDAKEEALQKEADARRASDMVTGFFADMLAAASPADLGRDATVRQMLDRAAATVGEQFADQPKVESRLRGTIGKTYVALGDYDKAAEHFRNLVDIYARIRGPNHELTLDARNALATALYFQGRLTEAAAEATAALEITRKLIDRNQPGFLVSLANTAFTTMRAGNFEQAEPLFREAIEILENSAEADSTLSLNIRSNLAQLYGNTNRRSEAESTYRNVIERSTRIRGPEHPETLLAIASLAGVVSSNRPDEALPLLQETYEKQARVLGESHSQTLVTLLNISSTLVRLGRVDEAELHAREGLRLAKQAYGDDHPRTLMFVGQLGHVCKLLNRQEEAEQLCLEYLNLASPNSVESKSAMLIAHRDLADIYLARHDFTSALAHTEALANRSESIDDSTRALPVPVSILLAQCHIGLGEYPTAEHLLLAAYEQAPGEAKFEVSDALSNLYDAWNRPLDVKQWRRQAEIDKACQLSASSTNDSVNALDMQ